MRSVGGQPFANRGEKQQTLPYSIAHCRETAPTPGTSARARFINGESGNRGVSSNSDDGVHSNGQSRDGNADGGSKVLRMLGPRWSPYARLARIDKPAGALLLAFPCWWGVALAAPMHSLPDPWLLFLFGSSAFVMR